ncbi:yemanuclein [Anoplophora glabripennis]|uniref:yemanuclein n=1 Tax=Anoplophora glabripennis TaxID=217634 RepID=UPI000C76A9D9|nr:yemanuclein [Anoplophora glabripennis]
MSEIKRVTLSTFEPQNVSDKVNKKSCKTVRISVILPESNEDNCPEYNYKDQLAAVKKRLKQGKEPSATENGLDPFPDDDDDVRRIALEMEAKYGSGMNCAKKKRKGRKDDYADIGMGYDESDSFIDNTDGYDEIIPQNVTTLHGGFYINCGALEFKTDEEASSDISSSSSESEDETRPSSNRKRILDTSEESESDTGPTSHLEKKPKLQSSKNTMQQAIKKKLFSQNKIQVKKRRLIDPLKKTVKDLLREKREDLNMSLPLELQDEKEDNVEKDSLKENKKPMSITSVTDAIESVVKQVVEETDYSPNQNSKQSSPDINKKNDLVIPKNVDVPSSIEGGESSQEANKLEKPEVKLPENLPADILDLINRIKQAALEYKGEGKKRFFSDEVNLMLLNLERKCKILGKSSRVRIYDHLSLYTKVRKETLSRRAKNLFIEDEERRLKKLTIKLKDNIDQIMPSLMMNFEQESQRILQKKFSKESADSEENKALKMPKRRFKWTDESRKLLKDILSIKKRCLILEGKQKDNLEDQVCQYLRKEILPLWPEGWMYLNSLKKVYNNMTENAKMLENNNSKNDTPKQHSAITITPVSNNKPPSKMDVSPNSVTFSKIGSNEAKAGPKVTEISPTSSHLSSFNINNLIPLKTSQPQKPNVVQPASTVKELEKPRPEKEHDFKKAAASLPESYKFSRNQEPTKTHPDSSVIIMNSRKDEINNLLKENKEVNAVISKTPHCQLIDLTDALEDKRKLKTEEIKTYKFKKEPPVPSLISSTNSNDYTDVTKLSSKHPELSVTPAFTQKPSSKSDGDEIQMVMENLKALQKLSSPIKADNPTSSPVSVIAYNRSFSPKSNSSQSSPGHRGSEFNPKTDFSGSFQDEFQKQFINSLQQMATASSSSKPSYNRCS